MKAAIIFFECITNMHVGSGEVNYNIIDNEVERDPVTGFPTIFSSGVKGALREFFETKGVDQDSIKKIFGSEKSNDASQGIVKILSADLIATPARASKGDKPYYLVSPKTAIDNLENKLQELCKQKIEKNSQKESDKAVEGINLSEKLTLQLADKLKLSELYLLEDKDYGMIDLPVMARNKLEDGTSKNLWYEEVVPHKSLFFFPVVVANDKDAEVLGKFLGDLEGEIVQFGGNASIGYGLCKITNIIRGAE